MTGVSACTSPTLIPLFQKNKYSILKIHIFYSQIAVSPVSHVANYRNLKLSIHKLQVSFRKLQIFNSQIIQIFISQLTDSHFVILFRFEKIVKYPSF